MTFSGVLLALLAQQVAHAQVTASLVAADSSAQPGRPFTAAVRLDHEPGWHTYWINPGIGMPTKLAWELPAGWRAGEIQWPTPTIIRGKEGEITGHGYDVIAYLPVTITPAAKAKIGEDVSIAVQAKWLMCTAETCIPGEGRATLTVPISADTPKPNAGVTAELARLPMPQLPKAWKISARRDARQITLQVAGAPLRSPYFFSEELEYIELDAPQTVKDQGGRYTVVLPIMEDATTQPTRLVGVLAYTDASGTYRGISVDVPFSKAAYGDSPPSLSSDREQDSSIEASSREPVRGVNTDSSSSSLRESVAATSLAGPEAPAEREGSISSKNARGIDADLPSGAGKRGTAQLGVSFSARVLIFAFIGGLILNLMPCVFPVLGIKVVGFINQAGSDRRKVTMHGLTFTAGVVLSFWALAGFLAVLRSGGEHLGWGFQLQSAPFVFVLAVVMLIFAMSLSGVFEFGLRAAGVGSNLQMKAGYSGSFFAGVLATVVATPCSAPFLAPALGAALALPTGQAFVVFTAIALGLSAPYLLLSAFPKAVRVLPKPGRWMETFKQFMAFPLYATMGFLVWVLAGQTSESELLSALLSLTVIAMGVWLYGRYASLRVSPRRVRVAQAGALALLALGLHLGWPRPVQAGDIIWEPWSTERIAQLRDEGRAIYVDFTARWCATCQANKRLVFSSDEVKKLFRDRNIALLKADWTNQDPRITDELARFNRSAVPFNLIYQPGNAEPIVLPSLLTPGIVLDAIRRE